MSDRDPVVLAVELAPGSSQLALTGADMPPVRFGFTVATADAAFPAPARALDGTVLLDGPAFAVLPVAMRAHRPLHVAGTVTRRALRDLTEYAAGWASFMSRLDAGALGPVTVSADTVIDDPAPPLGETAVLAWDGGMAAAAMLARHHLTMVIGALRPACLVHVAGLAPADHDDEVVRAIVPAAAAEGIPLIRLATNAAAAGALDRACGPLPLVAAALHLSGGPHRIGLIARNWTYPVLVRPNRPKPHMPDLLSGDRFTVSTDGGGLSPVDHARLAARLPTIVAAIRPRTPRDRDLAALGFAAAGIAPPPAVRRRNPLAAAIGLALDDGIGAEASRMIGPGAAPGAAMSVLRARLAAVCGGEVIVDHGRWIGALLGLREPWPR